VKGVTLRYDPKRKKPWGVWIEVIIDGKEMRGARFFALEADGRTAYDEACREIALLRAEADENARRRKELAVPPLPLAPDGTTLFETIAQRWLEEHVRPMLESATYRGYAGDLQRHLLPIMRTWPMTDEVMAPQRLKDLLKRQLFDKGLSLSARLSCQSCLSALFGWALGELPPGQLTWNPLLKQARYVRQESEKKVKLKQPPNPMTAVQAEAFLAWQKEHRPAFYEWFLWLVDAGSRIGEVSAVRWSVIDLDRGRAHIIAAYSSSERWAERQRGDTDGLGEKGTKTHREDQYIDLSDRLVEALRKLKVANLEQWMARGRPGKEPQHVFLTRRLTPRRPDNMVYEAFHDCCTALQLVGQTGNPFTIHCLRDTFATLAILGGKHIGWVSMMLGHADEQTTRRHYYKWLRLVDDNPLAGKRAREEE
jgi:integrase